MSLTVVLVAPRLNAIRPGSALPPCCANTGPAVQIRNRKQPQMNTDLHRLDKESLTESCRDICTFSFRVNPLVPAGGQLKSLINNLCESALICVWFSVQLHQHHCRQ